MKIKKVKVPKIRNDWGKVKPYTRIEENKKRKNELDPKHKKDFRDSEK